MQQVPTIGERTTKAILAKYVSSQNPHVASNERHISDGKVKEDIRVAGGEASDSDESFSDKTIFTSVTEEPSNINSSYSDQSKPEVLRRTPSMGRDNPRNTPKSGSILSRLTSKLTNRVARAEATSRASPDSGTVVGSKSPTRLASSILDSLRSRKGSKRASVVLDSTNASKQEIGSKIGSKRATAIFGSTKLSNRDVSSSKTIDNDLTDDVSIKPKRYRHIQDGYVYEITRTIDSEVCKEDCCTNRLYSDNTKVSTSDDIGHILKNSRVRDSSEHKSKQGDDDHVSNDTIDAKRKFFQDMVNSVSSTTNRYGSDRESKLLSTPKHRLYQDVLKDANMIPSTDRSDHDFNHAPKALKVHFLNGENKILLKLSKQVFDKLHHSYENEYDTEYVNDYENDYENNSESIIDFKYGSQKRSTVDKSQSETAADETETGSSSPSHAMEGNKYNIEYENDMENESETSSTVDDHDTRTDAGETENENTSLASEATTTYGRHKSLGDNLRKGSNNIRKGSVIHEENRVEQKRLQRLIDDEKKFFDESMNRQKLSIIPIDPNTFSKSDTNRFIASEKKKNDMFFSQKVPTAQLMKGYTKKRERDTTHLVAYENQLNDEEEGDQQEGDEQESDEVNEQEKDSLQSGTASSLSSEPDPKRNSLTFKKSDTKKQLETTASQTAAKVIYDNGDRSSSVAGSKRSKQIIHQRNADEHLEDSSSSSLLTLEPLKHDTQHSEHVLTRSNEPRQLKQDFKTDSEVSQNFNKYTHKNSESNIKTKPVSRIRHHSQFRSSFEADNDEDSDTTEIMALERPSSWKSELNVTKPNARPNDASVRSNASTNTQERRPSGGLSQKSGLTHRRGSSQAQKSGGGWSGSGGCDTHRVFMKSSSGFAPVDPQLGQMMEESMAASQRTEDGSGCTSCFTGEDDVMSVPEILQTLHDPGPPICEAGLPITLGDMIWDQHDPETQRLRSKRPVFY